jgi:hypothetical protein
MNESSTNIEDIIPYDLKDNPFPVSAPKDVDYWADNRSVLRQLLHLEVESLGFISTSTYIYWGPKGTGKTFAARYFSNERIMKKLSKIVKSPQVKQIKIIQIDAPFPQRSGGFTYNLHAYLVNRLIQDIINDNELTNILVTTVKKLDIAAQTVFDDILRILSQASLLDRNPKFLFSEIQKTQGYKQLTFKSAKRADNFDIILGLRILIDILLTKYTKLKIILDEMENLNDARLVDRLFFSDYVRKIQDRIEKNLDLVLIYTLDSFDDVKYTLSDALMSRIREKIEFKFVENKENIEEYIRDCIKFRGKKEINDMMDEEVLGKIVESFSSRLGTLTFRQINIEMRNILSKGYYFDKESDRLTMDIYLNSMETGSFDDETLENFKSGE